MSFLKKKIKKCKDSYSSFYVADDSCFKFENSFREYLVNREVENFSWDSLLLCEEGLIANKGIQKQMWKINNNGSKGLDSVGKRGKL